MFHTPPLAWHQSTTAATFALVTCIWLFAIVARKFLSWSVKPPYCAPTGSLLSFPFRTVAAAKPIIIETIAIPATIIAPRPVFSFPYICQQSFCHLLCFKWYFIVTINGQWHYYLCRFDLRFCCVA